MGERSRKQPPGTIPRWIRLAASWVLQLGALSMYWIAASTAFPPECALLPMDASGSSMSYLDTSLLNDDDGPDDTSPFLAAAVRPFPRGGFDCRRRCAVERAGTPPFIRAFQIAPKQSPPRV